MVPHYNDLDGLSRCLHALDQQSFPRDEFEIIVADNCSPIEPAELDAVVGGRARLVTASERGAGPARNAGVAAASGAILAFTDSDCVPRADWLKNGIAALAEYDLVGGDMVVTTRNERRSPAEAFEQVFAFRNADYIKRSGFSVTANLFCHATVFERVGGFRTGVSEDVDWCRRATRMGFRLGHAPGAIVAHPARADWSSLKHKWRRLADEGYRLACEQPGGRLRWHLASLALPLSIAAHVPRVLARRDLTPRERWEAFTVLARLRTWRFFDAQRRLFGRRG